MHLKSVQPKVFSSHIFKSFAIFGNSLEIDCGLTLLSKQCCSYIHDQNNPTTNKSCSKKVAMGWAY